MIAIMIMIMTKSDHIPLAVKRLMLSILIQQLVVDYSLRFKISLAGQTLISKYKTRRSSFISKYKTRRPTLIDFEMTKSVSLENPKEEEEKFEHGGHPS